MSSFENILQRPDTWQGFHSHKQSHEEQLSLSTRFQRLDKALHLGGWPKAALSELYTSRLGIGEISLLLPALASLAPKEQPYTSATDNSKDSPKGNSKNRSQKSYNRTDIANKPRAIFLVNPPHLLYPPMLAMEGINLNQIIVLQAKTEQQQLWACAEIMASGHCGACLFWAKQPMRQYATLRKLQLAAQQGNCHGFLFRPQTDLCQHSPAALRIELSPRQQELHIHIHKQRGGQAGQQLSLYRSPLLRSQQLLAVPKNYTQPRAVEAPSPRVPTRPTEEKRLWH